ncbi:MAG TPA: Crp/Fnr family transcriptional regulator [Candidatus Kapabacteria bacterium]|nr:Crp/Fnr family transcriptional regulator [Candidatus Kapabacteria bacterium]
MSRNLQCASPHCATCSARDRSVFTQLTPIELGNLSDTKGCRIYSKGELIFRADEFPKGLYCIHQGAIKIYKVGRDGKEQILRLARRGDILGYRSLISGERYRTFATPVDSAVICRIPKDSFLAMMTQSLNLSARIIDLLATELKAAEDKIVQIAQKPVRERLAEAFLMLHNASSEETDRSKLGINLTRGELANLVGTAAETVSRVLTNFKEERIIRMRGRAILINDYNALVNAANLQD